MIFGSVDHDGSPKLYVTDPVGTYWGFLASIIGRGAARAGEYLEKRYNRKMSLKDAIELALGFLFYPLIFTAILGYVYLKNQSVVVLAAAILIFVVAFGNTLFGVGIFGTFLHIIVALAFSVLMLIFISRRAGG